MYLKAQNPQKSPKNISTPSNHPSKSSKLFRYSVEKLWNLEPILESWSYLTIPFCIVSMKAKSVSKY